MKERYYKGICVKYSVRSRFFCFTEMMTFTEATFYAPMTIVVLIFFPTFAYLNYCSIKFYGWKHWVSGVLDNPTYYIFSIFTNISFYEYKEPDATSLAPSPNNSKDFWEKNPDFKKNLKKSLIDTPTILIHYSVNNEGKSI